MNTSFQFTRQKHALDKADFVHIMRTPQIRISTHEFVLLARENQLDLPRIGFIVSKKNVKKANARNSIRRVIRESVRLNQDKLKNHDFVFIVRKTAAPITKKDFRAKLEKQWNTLLKKHF